ncbi:DUF2306 domain-containing protein [Flavobacteriaceae bacterium TP-CH-4]|uniref:DUF2306 domain-containing protein n=1 Tax=Pelagihabitans pacificus TaxID=2696054 RepID=A0A967ECG6_9FLAO|nr:DUF2306 domain-containing protein [Pelagihabitans pacificus]NHF61201.1 DUF2306 domain-containing protein [Pelagihabitans pacificus]
MRKLAFITFLLVGAISMIVMSYHYFELDSTGVLERKEVAEELWYLFTFRTHILLGLVAISSGPFQFLEKVWVSYKSIHKRIGYVYVSSVIISSVSGLVIAQYAMGGWISTMGFSLLSVAWLFITIKSIISIRTGKINSHQKWMFLSYSLTFAAITQRTLLLVPLLTEVPFIPIYRLSAWLPWLLNLNIAYFLFSRYSSET